MVGYNISPRDRHPKSAIMANDVATKTRAHLWSAACMSFIRFASQATNLNNDNQSVIMMMITDIMNDDDDNNDR